jgi:hypothetical protein
MPGKTFADLMSSGPYTNRLENIRLGLLLAKCSYDYSTACLLTTTHNNVKQCQISQLCLYKNCGGSIQTENVNISFLNGHTLVAFPP